MPANDYEAIESANHYGYYARPCIKNKLNKRRGDCDDCGSKWFLKCMKYAKECGGNHSNSCNQVRKYADEYFDVCQNAKCTRLFEVNAKRWGWARRYRNFMKGLNMAQDMKRRNLI